MTYNRVYTVTDDCGNSKTCAASTTVQDTEPYLHFEPWTSGGPVCCDMQGYNFEGWYSSDYGGFYQPYIIDCNPLYEEDEYSYIENNDLNFLYNNLDNDEWNCGGYLNYGFTVSDACGNVGEYHVSLQTNYNSSDACNNPFACNYGNSFEYCVFPGDYVDLCYFISSNDSIYDNQCIPTDQDSFCWDESACNYAHYNGYVVGECAFPGDPCDDDNSQTVNDAFNEDCECAGDDIIEGCLDFTACNFNNEANLDDNSCCYENCGCTEPEALNYNPLAECNSGCMYVPGDSDGDNYIDASDLNAFLANFGTYCQQEEFCFGDLDGNGIVNSTDLAGLLAIFGQQF